MIWSGITARDLTTNWCVPASLWTLALSYPGSFSSWPHQICLMTVLSRTGCPISWSPIPMVVMSSMRSSCSSFAIRSNALEPPQLGGWSYWSRTSCTQWDADVALPWSWSELHLSFLTSLLKTAVHARQTYREYLGLAWILDRPLVAYIAFAAILNCTVIENCAERSTAWNSIRVNKHYRKTQ